MKAADKPHLVFYSTRPAVLSSANVDAVNHEDAVRKLKAALAAQGVAHVVIISCREAAAA